MVASPLMPTTFSSEITLIVASKVSRLCAYFSHIKLNTLKTSSYLEEIMNALPLTEFMDSMMSANVDTTSSSGRPSQIASIAYPLLQLSMKKSSVCMVVSHQNSHHLSKLRESWDQLMFQIQVFSVICFGQIPIRTFKVGVRMIVEYPSHLVRKLSLLLIRNMILIWSVEHIRLLKTVMNSLLRDSW